MSQPRGQPHANYYINAVVGLNKPVEQSVTNPTVATPLGFGEVFESLKTFKIDGLKKTETKVSTGVQLSIK